MAQSPTSERRARLIREMAQELNSTRHSLRSNSDFADVTGSNLSVEEESSQAYRDNSRPLPTLPSQSRTGTRLGGRPAGDFVIDSSAIGRAFPDMTGSATSAEDDDGSSISIELGRGLRDGARNLSDAGSVNLGPTPGQYKIDLGKLPSKGYAKTARSSLREVQNAEEQQQHVRSSPPPFKATTYGTSGSSGESGAENRRRPAKASVEDGSDHTSSSSTQNVTARGSRFGHGHSRPELAIPKRFTSGRDLLRDVHKTSTRADNNNNNNNNNNNPDSRQLKPIAENNTLTTTNGGTAQSFMLPNMPNMSELVSGVYDDGTPVFSRTTAGRFQNARNSTNIRTVQSLPVPQDEEAIMMSLRLLQDKVSHLERTKAEAEVIVKELQNKNRALEDERRELKRSRRSEGAAGSSGASDAGDEGLNGTHRANLDKQRLQSTIRNLQNELDGANRRAAVTEANAVNIAAERDAAIEQLGVAFVTQEELKVDNENLREDNRKLTIDNARYRAAINTYLKRAESERTETKSKITEEDSAQRDTRSVDCQVLDVDTPKRPSNTRREVPREVSRDQDDDLSAIQQPKRRRRRVIVEEYTATSDFQGFDDESIARIQEASRHLSQNLSQNISLARSASGPTITRRTQGTERTEVRENTKHDRSRALSVKALDDDVLSVHEPTKTNQTRNITQASRVSFLQEGDVTILRKMLEKEHLQKKARHAGGASGRPSNQADDQHDVTQLVDGTRNLPLKSSMKDATGRHTPAPETTVHTDIDEEEQTQATEPVPTAAHRRRHSEASLFSHKTGQAKSKALEDMTSAFILPDITMNIRPRQQNGGEVDVSAPLSIPAEAIQSAAPHESQNCTVCVRLSGTCAQCRENGDEAMKVPTPILASERIRDLAAEGEDHTTRPSEPPAVALARTIKALEDEFAHIGMQLTALQQQYVELDPSLQKRKRKSVGASIDSLRSALDAKGDQIYALYDVLEGQGPTGHRLEEMTEQEANDTLSSVLGEDANLGNLGMPSGIMFKRGQKTSTADVTPAKERAKSRTMMATSTTPKGAGSVLSGITEARTEEKEEEEASRPASSIGGTPIGKKFPWEDLDDADEDDLSWQGFDDTLDLTKGSRKSNTSSKRRGATNVSIEL